MGRQELCAENAKKTQKLEKLKHKLLNFLTRSQFWILGVAIESAWALHGWFHADSMAALKSDYCGRVFFFDTA